MSGHLDILGHYQFEPCEFNKPGHFLGDHGGVGQKSILVISWHHKIFLKT